MAKFLLVASYTTEGVKGLLKDGGSKRRRAAEAAVQSVGGRMESFHFALGADDVYAVIDAPDNAAAAALSMVANASGAVTTRMVPLLTPDELDQAAKKNATYTPPGQ